MPKYDNEEKFTELADRLEKEDATKYATIIARCRSNDYHDFYSPDESSDGTMIGPKMLMVKDLREADLEEEALKVIDGDYDQ